MKANNNVPLKKNIKSNVVCLQCIRIALAYQPKSEHPHDCQGYCCDRTEPVKRSFWDVLKMLLTGKDKD